LDDRLRVQAAQAAVLERVRVHGRPHDVDAALVAAGAERVAGLLEIVDHEQLDLHAVVLREDAVGVGSEAVVGHDAARVPAPGDDRHPDRPVEARAAADGLRRRGGGARRRREGAEVVLRDGALLLLVRSDHGGRLLQDAVLVERVPDHR
jgi:hypothetical protein